MERDTTLNDYLDEASTMDDISDIWDRRQQACLEENEDPKLIFVLFTFMFVEAYGYKVVEPINLIKHLAHTIETAPEYESDIEIDKYINRCIEYQYLTIPEMPKSKLN